ncbi:MAG: cysteine hydrolase [Rhizobiaceae bacterium]
MTSLYLVLDMQNDLVHADGPNGKSGLGIAVHQRQILARTRQAVDKARAAGTPVAFVRVGFSPDYRECPRHSAIFAPARENGLFKLGSWGTEIHPELGKSDADFDIVKHRVSAFYGTTLEPILAAKGVSTIVVSGVSTTAAVQSTVRDAHDRDYRCIVLEDCCAAATAEEHDASIVALKRFAQIAVQSDDAWLAGLPANREGRGNA